MKKTSKPIKNFPIKFRLVAAIIAASLICCGFAPAQTTNTNTPQTTKQKQDNSANLAQTKNTNTPQTTKQNSSDIYISDENISKLMKMFASFMYKDISDVEYVKGRIFITRKNGEEEVLVWNGQGFTNLSDGIRILAAGDNLIHSGIYKYALQHKDGSFDFLYKDIRDSVKKADFSILNQETPLVGDPSMYSGYPCFGTPVSIAESIKEAGFDAVTLSTNHMFDKGAKGLDTTMQAFDDLKILRIGGISDKPYKIISKNGIKIALLNYTYGTNGIPEPKGYEGNAGYLLKDEDKIREDIKRAKAKSDAVIVFPHWGTEYSKTPDSMQKKWTEFFYSCGVTAVVGTHPHVLEECEMYSEKGSKHEMLVYYSLGNFVSTNQVPGHNSGGIAEFTLKLTKDGVKVSDYTLTEINTNGIEIMRNDSKVM